MTSSKRVRTSDDPAGLATARAAKGVSIDPLEALFADSWLLGEARFQGFLRSGTYDERLRARAHDDAVPRDVRLIAAAALCLRGEPSAEEVLANLLADDRARGSDHVVAQLGVLLSDGDVALGSSRLCAQLLATLDAREPDKLRRAVQAVGILNVPGSRERFRALLDAPLPISKGRIAFWLAHRWPTLEQIDRLAAMARAEPDATARGEFVDAVAWSAQPDKATAASARETLAALLEEGLRPGNRQMAAGVLAAAPMPALRPLLERMSLEGDSYSRGRALQGLARLDGALGLDRLRRAVDDDAVGWAALEAVGERAFGSRDPALRDELLLLARPRPAPTPYDAYKEERRRRRVLEALVAIGVDEETFTPLLDGLGVYDRCALLWQHAGRSPREALQAFVREGVPLEGSAEAPRAGSLADLLESLEDRGASFGFDTEGDPGGHADLARGFSWASRGRFRPEGLLQEGAQLRFAANERVYEVTLEPRGDWLDHGAVAEGVNAALADAGGTERFLSIDTGDQKAHYLFADPAVARRLARAFVLPLLED